jgi:hypothetical protein
VKSNRDRTDEDSPWKDIIEHYFCDFMAFFFPQVHGQIDWQQPHKFLDKELQKITRDANVGRRYADKLVSVSLLSGTITFLLIHIEVQGAKETEFAERIYRYNFRIRDRYNIPVSSFVILCDNQRNWHPSRYQQTLPGTQLNFEFSSVKLLDYQSQWETLEDTPNPFATVVMAHLKTQATRKNMPQRKAWKFALTRRLYQRGYQRQDVLNLLLFIDWIMVLPEPMDALFWQEVEVLEQEERMPYMMGIERIKLEQGRQEGRQEGSKNQSLRLLLMLLRQRFKKIPTALQNRLKLLSVKELEKLAKAILTVPSLAEFEAKVAAIEAATAAKPRQPNDDE